MKKYKTIDSWKGEMLKKHSDAEFTEYENTVSSSVKTSEFSSRCTGFISKGNLKGIVYST